MAIKNKQGKKTNIKRIIFLYILGTLIAGSIAVIASFIFPIQLKLGETASSISPPGGINEVLKTLLMNIVSNPVDALVNANYIGILTWAVLLGIALKKASQGTKNAIENIADALSQKLNEKEIKMRR